MTINFPCFYSGLPTNDVVPTLKQRVLDFKQGMPVIVSLRNPSLRPRHWLEIENLIGRQIPRGQMFTLGNLLEMKVSISNSVHDKRRFWHFYPFMVHFESLE